MSEGFRTLLRTAVSGSLEQIYADAAVSIDQKEIHWDGSTLYKGTISIYSRSDVFICGEVKSLHPLVYVRENRFEGNTTIHYELNPGGIPFQSFRRIDGILILYNGGEIIIPLYFEPVKESSEQEEQEVSSSKTDQKKESAFRQKRKNQTQLARQMQSLLVDSLVSEDGEVPQMGEELLNLNRRFARTESDGIKGCLYEAVWMLQNHEFTQAARLERKVRPVILTERKKYAVEYAMLLYVQFYLAVEEKQVRDAAVKKKQYAEAVKNAVAGAPKDPALPWLLCVDFLPWKEEVPEELWKTFEKLYEEGNSSPFLYLYGCSLLEKAKPGTILHDSTDHFIMKCVEKGLKCGILSEGFTALMCCCTPSVYSAFTCRLYRMLYKANPTADMLSKLCTILIRCDQKTEEAFSIYERAVNEKNLTTRLYEYYMYALPADYSRPIPEDIFEYFALDSLIDPRIYVKLLLNMNRFYKSNRRICELYGKELPEFLRRQILRRNWSYDLALLADETLTSDMIDEELAAELIPMLCLVQIRADLNSGCLVRCESRIYREWQEAVLEGGQACLVVPEETGNAVFFDRNGRKLTQVRYEMQKLLQNQEIYETCRELCPDCDELLILHHYKWIMNEEYEQCDLQFSLEFLKKETPAPAFRRKMIDYILWKLRTQSCFAADIRYLCSCISTFSKEQQADFIEILIHKGYYTEAAQYLACIPYEGIKIESMKKLAEVLSGYPEQEEGSVLMGILLYLFRQDAAGKELLTKTAMVAEGRLDELFLLHENCLIQGIRIKEFTAKLLLRMFLTQSQDFEMMQRLFLDTVEDECSELISQAVLNYLCCSYIMGRCELEADCAAVIQAELMQVEEVDYITIPCQMALLKYDQEIGCHHEIQKEVLRKICLSLLKKGIVLEFLYRAAASTGIAVYPVVQTDKSFETLLQACQLSGEEKNTVSVQLEYQIDEDEEIQMLSMKKGYAGVYTAQVPVFAGEQMRYRFCVMGQKSEWKKFQEWNYYYQESVEGICLISDRYRLLQNILAGTLQKRDVSQEILEYNQYLKAAEAAAKTGKHKKTV